MVSILTTIKENPLVLSYFRLQHRSGNILSAGLLLLMGLASLVFYFNVDPENRVQSVGYVYSLLLILQGGTAYFAVFSSVSRSLQSEREKGLFEQNYLTPLKPAFRILGYCIGPSLRHLALTLILSALSLLILLHAGFPFLYWLKTQFLIYLALPFFALTAILTGITVRKGSSYVSLMVACFIGLWVLARIGSGSLVSFIIPYYALADALYQQMQQLLGPQSQLEAVYELSFFGMKFNSTFMTFLIQVCFATLLWKILLEKFKNHHSLQVQPLYIYLFSLAVCGTQAGLVYGNPRWGLNIIHVVFLILTWALLSTMRLSIQELLPSFKIQQKKKIPTLIKKTLPAHALILTVISLFFLTLVASSTEQGLHWYWIGPFINFMSIALFFACWREICDLRFAKRAQSFFSFWYFDLFSRSLCFAGSQPASSLSF